MNWNNRRRNAGYWVSVGILLALFLNTSWWLDLDHPAVKKLGHAISEFYEWILPFSDLYAKYLYGIMCMLFTFDLLALVLLALVNHLIGILPERPRKERGGIMQMMYENAFWGDLIVGIIIEYAGLQGIFSFTENMEVGSPVLWICTALYLLASWLYWKSVFPIREYVRAISLLRGNKEFEDRFWYGLTNGAGELSTFSRVPWKGRILETIISPQDLKRISESAKNTASDTDFFHYLIIADRDEEIGVEFRRDVERIVRIPHAKVQICLFGAEKAADDFLDRLAACPNVRVESYQGQKLTRDLDLEQLISKTVVKKNSSVRMPMRFIPDDELKRTYLDIGVGPTLCLDFMKVILNDLEILPAIYALFDFIDMQYRIMIAYYREPDYRWMRSRGMIIGNLTKMRGLLETRVLEKNMKEGRIRITLEQIFTCIISKEEKTLIYKYLPNYEIDHTLPVYSTIVYLSASLRNVLRGHGTFDEEDAGVLFELVFKLALMNAHILSIDRIRLRSSWLDGDSGKVFGCSRVPDSDVAENDKCLSPFLISSESGDILVFNNWIKRTENSLAESIEYIRYQNGTLVLVDAPGRKR